VEDILGFYGKEKEIHFKSPTGSGKTLMATSVISQIMNNNPHEKLVFVIATISSASLPQAFEEKIRQYKASLPFKDFEVEYIESPSANKIKKKDYTPQIRVERNKVYIFGKATFGKDRIFTEQEIFHDFVKECKQQGYKLVYIRDEAHIGTARTDAGIKTFESLMQENADFIIKMTATFNNKSTNRRIELKEEDLKDDTKNDGKWLIKCNAQVIYNETITDEELMDLAIAKFKEIKEEYKKLDCHIKPAMLIQVDSEPSDPEKKELFHKTLKILQDKLKEVSLSWVQYFGTNDKSSSNVDNENFTLSKITRNTDATDCIIFKIGPATGWDIPRACMLLQLRNVCSQSLNIQTIGRIKRNPYQKLEWNEITDKYYIFANEANNNKDYNVYKYTVKKEFEKEVFAVIKLDKQSERVDQSKIDFEVATFIQQKKQEILQKASEILKDNIFLIKEKKLQIKNCILLLKHVETLNLNILQKHIFTKIAKHFEAISREKVFLVLYYYFLTEVKTIIAMSANLDVVYKLDFVPFNPNIYHEVFEKNKETQVDVEKSHYLFEIQKFSQNQTKQPVDSENESEFGKKLSNYLEILRNETISTIWAKNPRNSNIYGEYLDDEYITKRSYFDFVVKFNNGNYLYIEVKGGKSNDIDTAKTALLERAYANYFNKTTSNLLAKVVICLAKVEKDTVSEQYFYNKNQIENIDGKTLSEVLKMLSI
jgi:type III restriction enzyme